MIASAWYALCGYEVLWPLEPCRYDFAARCHDLLERVQVKTTTYGPSGVAVVSLSNSRRGNRAVYAKAEVDHFLVVDDQLNGYRIPITAVIGRQHVHLRRYERFRVVVEGRLLPPNDRAAG